MSERERSVRVTYRCWGCGAAFTPATPGAAPCPRCQSIGGHEPLGRAGGDVDLDTAGGERP